MLRAYCDASAKGGIHAVAGVAFGEDRARKATHAFTKLFGRDRQCHMTDLHNQKKQFSDIGGPEAARLCTGAVEIINRYATVIVVASCDEADVERLAVKSQEVLA